VRGKHLKYVHNRRDAPAFFFCASSMRGKPSLELQPQLLPDLVRGGHEAYCWHCSYLDTVLGLPPRHVGRCAMADLSVALD
jgi:hypothetical protein